MKTLQMEDYDFSNIILYKVVDIKGEKRILVFTDKTEQLNKYVLSKDINDAPIGILDYSIYNINEIVSKMKKIHTYRLLGDSVLVNYEDDSSYNFSLNEVDTIEKILNEQRKDSVKSNKISINKDDIMDTIKDNIIDNIASIIADIEFNYSILDIDPTILFNNKYLKIISQVDTKTSTFYEEQGKVLFDLLNSDDNFKKYKDAIEIDFDEQLASEILQVINGYYPETLTYMSLDDYRSEIIGALNVMITLLTSVICQSSSSIDISKFIYSENEKVLVNTIVSLSNNVVNYLVNAKLFDVEHYLNEVKLDNDFINNERQKFNRMYVNPFDELLNYMYSTVTGSVYSELNIGVKIFVLLCFKIISSLIPETSYISHIDNNDVIYYKYYKVFDKSYYPRSNNGELEFFVPDSDEVISTDDMINYINDGSAILLGIGTIVNDEFDKNIKLLLSVTN